MAHFMNSEISTPLNNDMYTEYASVFSFCLDFLYTLKLFRFSLLGMYVYNYGKVSTTFAHMHIYTVTITYNL